MVGDTLYRATSVETTIGVVMMCSGEAERFLALKSLETRLETFVSYSWRTSSIRPMPSSSDSRWRLAMTSCSAS